MSRKRNLDRALLESSADELLDEEDQERLIEALNSRNRQILVRNRRYFAVLLLVELIYVLLLKKRSIPNVILNVSILLSWVSLFGERLGALAYLHYISYANWAISAILPLTLFHDLHFTKLHCILPLMNSIMQFVMSRWYAGIDKDVTELNKYKYKYKNV